MTAISEYFRQLGERFGEAWTQFWFVPRNPYTLCVLRVLTGLAAIYWQFTYGPDLVALFGNEGLLPVSLISDWTGWQVSRSYLDFMHSPGELWTAHIIGSAILVTFTIGLFTRVTAVLALVVVLSYIHRAPMITGQFEPVLAFVLFYLCFAPCGRYLSLDAWLAARRPATDLTLRPDELAAAAESWTATVATRLIQVHLTLVYAMMGLAKASGEVWWSGQAMWWILAKPESRAFDLTHALADHPYFINAWTLSIVIFEIGFAILIWNQLARPLLLAIAALMWTLLALATGFFLFAWIMFAASLAFIEPDGMRALLGPIGSRDRSARAQAAHAG